MDLQNLTDWLEEELQHLTELLKVKLQLGDLEVSPADSIAEKGLVGDSGWIEIRWQAEARFLWGHRIPDEEFESLECFADLLPLIMRLHVELAPQKTLALSAA